MENLVNTNKLFEVYNNKKVLITGHTGFKGSWLTLLLHHLGAKLKGYALEPEFKHNLYNIISPLNIIESVIADVRDRKKIAEEVKNFQPDFIFHLAAQPLVLRSYAIPAETFEVNVIGTANLLEALINFEKKCTTVIITTDKVYENKEQNVLYSETDMLGGYDAYSTSKACAELTVNSFRNSFFNPKEYTQHQKVVLSARAGNVIGGGDWSNNRIIPDIIKSLQENKVIKVRHPNAVRPWQHVLEPLIGYLLYAALADSAPQNYASTYNFGPYPQDHLTVKELVQSAISIWGNGDWKDVSSPSDVHEAGLLQLNIENAMQDLEWEPKLNSATAINWTVDWYKQPSEEQAGFTLQQIKNYLAL